MVHANMVIIWHSFKTCHQDIIFCDVIHISISGLMTVNIFFLTVVVVVSL